MHEKLVGTWSLVSWEAVANGARRPYFGPGAVGRLTYTADGQMQANVMAKHRPAMGMTPEDARAAATDIVRPWRLPRALRGLGAVLRYCQGAVSYIAYAGTWRIDGDDVVHHVDVCVVQDWVGRQLRRRIDVLTDDELLLVSDPEAAPVQHFLRWRRADRQ